MGLVKESQSHLPFISDLIVWAVKGLLIYIWKKSEENETSFFFPSMLLLVSGRRRGPPWFLEPVLISLVLLLQTCLNQSCVIIAYFMEGKDVLQPKLQQLLQNSYVSSGHMVKNSILSICGFNEVFI